MYCKYFKESFIWTICSSLICTFCFFTFFSYFLCIASWEQERLLKLEHNLSFCVLESFDFSFLLSKFYNKVWHSCNFLIAFTFLQIHRSIVLIDHKGSWEIHFQQEFCVLWLVPYKELCSLLPCYVYI